MISSFQPLYKANGKEVFSSDVIAALEKVGIKNGDTIFVHSDVSVFGKLAFPLGRELLLGALVEVLKRAVGREGTLIMPTFTYSFCKGEIYDIDKSTVLVPFNPTAENIGYYLFYLVCFLLRYFRLLVHL